MLYIYIYVYMYILCVRVVRHICNSTLFPTSLIGRTVRIVPEQRGNREK